MFYRTIEQARDAVQEAHMDVGADFGGEAAEHAHTDIVRAIAENCTPEVKAELLRREGVQA